MAKRKKYWPVSESAKFVPKVLSGDILSAQDEQVTELAIETLRDCVMMESTMPFPPEVQAELRGIARGLFVGDKNRSAINIDVALPVANKETLALAVLASHPEWTDARIARTVDCSRTSLYRWPKFTKAREILKQNKDRLPSGKKDTDGELEAWDT